MKYKKIKIIEPKSEQPEEGVITLESTQLINLKHTISCRFELRSSGELRSKAFFLSSNIDGKPVDWIIVEDSTGNLCAVPFTEKELK